MLLARLLEQHELVDRIVVVEGDKAEAARLVRVAVSFHRHVLHATEASKVACELGIVDGLVQAADEHFARFLVIFVGLSVCLAASHVETAAVEHMWPQVHHLVDTRLVLVAEEGETATPSGRRVPDQVRLSQRAQLAKVVAQCVVCCRVAQAADKHLTVVVVVVVAIPLSMLSIASSWLLCVVQGLDCLLRLKCLKSRR